MTAINPGGFEVLDVAGRVCELWQAQGEAAEVIDWDQFSGIGVAQQDNFIKSIVVVPRLNRVECVLDGGDDLPRAAMQLHALTETGWAVSALLPVQELGYAHEVMRGMQLDLQGWVEGLDCTLRFDAPEVP